MRLVEAETTWPQPASQRTKEGRFNLLLRRCSVLASAAGPAPEDRRHVGALSVLRGEESPPPSRHALRTLHPRGAKESTRSIRGIGDGDAALLQRLEQLDLGERPEQQPLVLAGGDAVRSHAPRVGDAFTLNPAQRLCPPLGHRADLGHQAHHKEHVRGVVRCSKDPVSRLANLRLAARSPCPRGSRAPLHQPGCGAPR